jgi:fermentation-respiration switch protein FrsA (DUF1100 family)
VKLAAWGGRIRGTVIAVVVAYLVILLLVRIFESKLIFFPNYPGRLEGDWHPRGLPIEDVSIETADGVKLHSWWIPNPGAKFTFLAFHGNASNIANRGEVYRFLSKLPVNVLAVEYRGYGRSGGEPSEQGFYQDAHAAYDYLLRSRGIRPEAIVAFGQSLGSAVAVDLATQRKVRGIILEAPFPSARAVAKKAYPFLPGAGWVAKSKFDTARKLAGLAVPILVVHCTNDPVIPSPLSEEVFRAAREPKSFLEIPGMCHEEASQVSPERYAARLQEFLGSLAHTN